MDIVGANAGLFNTNPWPVPKSSGELQPYFSTSDLNSKAECSLASPKKDDGAGGRGVDEGSGGIPMPCALLDSMARGDAIGSMRSYGFSMGSKHAVWVSKDTSWVTVDPETEILTKHYGPGGVYVWIDDPDTGQKKPPGRKMTKDEINALLNDILMFRMNLARRVQLWQAYLRSVLARVKLRN
jgi:hypothetical protein